MRFLGLLFLTASMALAGESVVLASGSRMHVDRHENDGSLVRLFNGDGYVEMAAVLVRGFEPDEVIPPVTAAPSPGPALAAAPIVAATQPSPGELADAAADKYHLPRKLVRSVMRAESGFQPGAISPKGAIGLMQLMPATAQSLGVDPHDPVQNVDAGARYLRSLLEKYDGYLWPALAAYNAGPAAVDRYKGIPPYRETVHYVWKIDQILNKDR
jgi:soluble lytic murein transglycosylase-like protein